MVHKLSKPASSARRAEPESSGPIRTASVALGKPLIEMPIFMLTMVGPMQSVNQGPLRPWDCQYHPQAAVLGQTGSRADR